MIKFVKIKANRPDFAKKYYPLDHTWAVEVRPDIVITGDNIMNESFAELEIKGSDYYTIEIDPDTLSPEGKRSAMYLLKLVNKHQQRSDEMTKQDRIESIYEAIELIEEAQSLVQNAINGTEIENAFNAYGKFGFDTLLNNGNPYNKGLQDIINSIRNSK